jgi:hypothetical protein
MSNKLNKRARKVEWFLETVRLFFAENKEKVIDKDKLISEFCLVFNSTERTAKEILKILEDTEQIKTIDKKYIINQNEQTD